VLKNLNSAVFFSQDSSTGSPKTCARLPHRVCCQSAVPSLYRVLARVLAARFAPALGAALGPEQTAYLPDRRIEDSILHTSLMHQAMQVAGISGAAIFLDIAKAFDSVSRSFLYLVMQTMGATEGMIAWARLLLSNSWATTHANGVESTPTQWHAGVRQGSRPPHCQLNLLASPSTPPAAAFTHQSYPPSLHPPHHP
jgi:hypothetical protein